MESLESLIHDEADQPVCLEQIDFENYSTEDMVQVCELWDVWKKKTVETHKPALDKWQQVYAVAGRKLFNDNCSTPEGKKVEESMRDGTTEATPNSCFSMRPMRIQFDEDEKGKMNTAGSSISLTKLHQDVSSSPMKPIPRTCVLKVLDGEDGLSAAGSLSASAASPSPRKRRGLCCFGVPN
jgi:hypothetical protein